MSHISDSEIIEALKIELDTSVFKAFNDAGELVDANRPMIESIICDVRTPRIIFYAQLALTKVVVTPNGREIHVNTGTAIGLASGTG